MWELPFGQRNLYLPWIIFLISFSDNWYFFSSQISYIVSLSALKQSRWSMPCFCSLRPLIMDSTMTSNNARLMPEIRQPKGKTVWLYPNLVWNERNCRYLPVFPMEIKNILDNLSRPAVGLGFLFNSHSVIGKSELTKKSDRWRWA